jgi:hypothetical protein
MECLSLGAPPSPRWHGQRGGARLKAIVWTIILVACVYVGWKEAPPRMNDYQLHDKMKEEALFAAASRKSADDVRNAVFERIQELGIPAKKEDIKVEVNLRGCRISLDYDVPVDLSVYQHVIHFSTAVDNRSL